MRLYDSLRRAAVKFEPRVPGEVTIYGCGPTVYNFAHIGNFRTFLVYDLLHRALIREGYRVRFVVNLTDVDDKTINGAAEA
ncbi:MAG: cysteine--tRNA ligase, partial [Gemmatimonadetes bacterium]|nr:cysteine--tRNA ligase [Gemmatimonadota bacterium]